MSETFAFDYYYGREAEQYAFYRIPKALIKDKHFAVLSDAAKMLYGLMLDRMSLSIKNHWQDDQDRTYIIYTLDNIMEDMNCGRAKAVKIVSELDANGGIGLIEKVRRGQGKPDLIYIKNFARAYEDDKKEQEIVKKEPANPHKTSEVRKSNFKKYDNETSRSSKTKLQEVPKSNFKKYDSETSRSTEIELPEVPESNPNYNDFSNTDRSENEYSDTDFNDTKVKSGDVPYPIHPFYPSKGYRPLDFDGNDEMRKATEYLHEVIEYDLLVEVHPYDKRQIDEIVQLMVETILSRAETIRINGADVPQVIVRSKFEKYDSSIIEYVLECLRNNTSKVKNIRSYLLTTLYNAPTTIENYYQAEVQHDMYEYIPPDHQEKD